MYKEDVVSVRISKEAYKLIAEEKKKTGIPMLYTMEKAIKEYFERKNDN